MLIICQHRTISQNLNTVPKRVNLKPLKPTCGKKAFSDNVYEIRLYFYAAIGLCKYNFPVALPFGLPKKVNLMLFMLLNIFLPFHFLPQFMKLKNKKTQYGFTLF